MSVLKDTLYSQIKKLQQVNQEQDSKLYQLEMVIRDTLWMARRYALGRQTYAPSTVNAAVEKCKELGINIGGDITLEQDGNSNDTYVDVPNRFIVYRLDPDNPVVGSINRVLDICIYKIEGGDLVMCDSWESHELEDFDFGEDYDNDDEAIIEFVESICNSDYNYRII